MGILFAFVAMVSWALGDFFTQKSVREVGTLKNLFFFGAVGVILLSPFALTENDWGDLFDPQLFILIALLMMVSIAANIFDFEALKKGRFAIIQPVYSIELPLILVLSILVLGEKIDLFQWISIATVFGGLFFIIRNKVVFKKLLNTSSVESGALWAIASSSALALSGLLVALSAREISPFLIAWIEQLALFIFAGLWIVFGRTGRGLIKEFKKNKRLIILQGFFQTLAITSFAFAVLYGKLSIVSVISGSYVILSVFLGVIINKEKIQNHQKFGIVVSILGLILLTILDSGVH